MARTFTLLALLAALSGVACISTQDAGLVTVNGLGACLTSRSPSGACGGRRWAAFASPHMASSHAPGEAALPGLPGSPGSPGSPGDGAPARLRLVKQALKRTEQFAPLGEEKRVPDIEPTYLVFHLPARNSKVQSGTTATFLYALKDEKVEVSKVLASGEYFTSVQRMKRYADQEGFAGKLQFDSLQYLSDGPGPFVEHSLEARQYPAATDGTFPDVFTDREFSPLSIARLRGYAGGFVFMQPSGIVADEQWVLSTGKYVRDAGEFEKLYNASRKAPLWVYRVEGNVLE